MANLAVLLDNATLCASARVLGFPPTETAHDEFFDLDVAASAILIESIVLFEEIYALESESGPYLRDAVPDLDRGLVRWIPRFSDADTAHIESEAAATARNWRVSESTDGTLGNLVEVLESLNVLLNSQVQLYTRSESKLVLQLLGVDDFYNSAVVQELINPRDQHGERVYDSRSSDYIVYTRRTVGNEEGRRLMRNISWLTLRTAFYRIVSQRLGLAYQPHQVRARFLEFGILCEHLEPTLGSSYEVIARKLMNFVHETRDQIITEVNQIFGVAEMRLPMPPIFVAVLKHANTPEQILPIAVQLRASPNATALRHVMHELQWASEQGKVDHFLAINRKLLDLREALKKELGIGRQSIELENTWNLLLTKIKGPSMRIPLPKMLERPLYVRDRYMAFVRDLTRDVTCVFSLGPLYDRLFGKRPRRAV